MNMYFATFYLVLIATSTFFTDGKQLKYRKRFGRSKQDDRLTSFAYNANLEDMKPPANDRGYLPDDSPEHNDYDIIYENNESETIEPNLPRIDKYKRKSFEEDVNEEGLKEEEDKYGEYVRGREYARGREYTRSYEDAGRKNHFVDNRYNDIKGASSLKTGDSNFEVNSDEYYDPEMTKYLLADYDYYAQMDDMDDRQRPKIDARILRYLIDNHDPH